MPIFNHFIKRVLTLLFFVTALFLFLGCTPQCTRFKLIDDHRIIDILSIQDIDEDLLIAYSYLGEGLKVSHAVARFHDHELVWKISMDGLLERADDTRLIDLIVKDSFIYILLNGRTSSNVKEDIIGFIEMTDPNDVDILLETFIIDMNRGYSGHLGILDLGSFFQIVYTKDHNNRSEVHVITPGLTKDQMTDEVLEVALEQEDFTLYGAYYHQGYYFVYTYLDGQEGYFYDTSIDYINEEGLRQIVYTSEYATPWVIKHNNLLVLYQYEIHRIIILDATTFDEMASNDDFKDLSIHKSDVIKGDQSIFFVSSFLDNTQSGTSSFYAYYEGYDQIELTNRKTLFGEGDILYYYESNHGLTVTYFSKKASNEAEIIMIKSPVD